jgi:hypothetical protein
VLVSTSGLEFDTKESMEIEVLDSVSSPSRSLSKAANLLVADCAREREFPKLRL